MRTLLAKDTMKFDCFLCVVCLAAIIGAAAGCSYVMWIYISNYPHLFGY